MVELADRQMATGHLALISETSADMKDNHLSRLILPLEAALGYRVCRATAAVSYHKGTSLWS